MPYIKVEHSKFSNAVSALNEYTTVLENSMNGAQNEVSALSNAWQGADYAQFKREFDKLDNKDSVHARMLKSMKSYSKYLEYVSKQYKEVQNRAVIRANRLPKW